MKNSKTQNQVIAFSILVYAFGVTGYNAVSAIRHEIEMIEITAAFDILAIQYATLEKCGKQKDKIYEQGQENIGSCYDVLPSRFIKPGIFRRFKSKLSNNWVREHING